MSIVANTLLGMAQTWASIRSRIPQYEYVSKDKITMKFVKPDETEKAYDMNNLPHSHLFIRGYANPVELKEEEITKGATAEFKPNANYKALMKQKIVDQMLFGEGMKITKIFWLCVAQVGILTIFSLIIIALVS